MKNTRTVVGRHIATLFVAAVASCAAPVREKGGTLELFYKAGFNDEYSSRHGFFRRAYCRTEDQYVDARLSPAQLDKIGALAASLGFFSWPERLSWDETSVTASELSKLPDEARLDRICVIAPCATSRIKLTWQGQTHQVEWDTCTCGVLEHGEGAERLVRAIENELESIPEIVALPESDCRYY